MSLRFILPAKLGPDYITHQNLSLVIGQLFKCEIYSVEISYGRVDSSLELIQMRRT